MHGYSRDEFHDGLETKATKLPYFMLYYHNFISVLLKARYVNYKTKWLATRSILS